MRSVEMHTSGEPARIVYAGYPDIPYEECSARQDDHVAAADTSIEAHFSSSAMKLSRGMTTSDVVSSTSPAATRTCTLPC